MIADHEDFVEHMNRIEDVRDFERHLEKIDEEIQTRLKHKQELTAAWNVDRRERY